MVKCEITCDNCGKVLMTKELKTTLFKANSVHRICFEKEQRTKHFDLCKKCWELELKHYQDRINERALRELKEFDDD